MVKDISEKVRVSTSNLKGLNYLKTTLLQQVFKDKQIKIDIDELKNKELKDVNLADKNWYAQNEFYGTDEEQKFISLLMDL